MSIEDLDFEVLPSNERFDNPHVGIFIHRKLNNASLTEEPQIDHHANDFWSTHWLDIIFNSNYGDGINIQNYDFFSNIEPHSPIRWKKLYGSYVAFPCERYKGYYHFQFDYTKVFFRCKVKDLSNPLITHFFFVALTNEEIDRLKMRIKFNKDQHRCHAIFNFLKSY
jgi:hypothetical protein